MASVDDSRLLADAALAAELVRDAATLAAEIRSGGLDVERKTSGSDVVTQADTAAERLIVERLGAERPDDAIVGEEGTSRLGTSGRTWVIDPVDGTYNFLSGLPYWCSAVGLTDDEGPLLGAVYYPARDELWVGGRDRPTTRNGEPVTVLGDQPLEQVSVATYLHPRNLRDEPRVASWRSAVGAAATVRMLGSASVDLAGVASGRIGVFLQANLHPWDWFPGAALVLGAGGAAEVAEIDGNRWQVAGNTRSVAETVAALRQGG